jgi:hypothetical protein
MFRLEQAGQVIDSNCTFEILTCSFFHQTSFLLHDQKDFCDSIGEQNTCNGNLEFMTPPGTVEFTITPAAEDGTTTVGVVIDDEVNTSGTSSDDGCCRNS